MPLTVTFRYKTGDTVAFCDGLKGTVLGVRITGNDPVPHYEIQWWDGFTRQIEYFAEWQIEGFAT